APVVRTPGLIAESQRPETLPPVGAFGVPPRRWFSPIERPTVPCPVALRDAVRGPGARPSLRKIHFPDVCVMLTLRSPKSVFWRGRRNRYEPRRARHGLAAEGR